MFRIFIFNFIFTFQSLGASASGEPHFVKNTKALLNQPLKTLFSHPKHSSTFKQFGVQCTDCHRFSVKPEEAGVLSEPVPSGYLESSKQVCHQCHIAKLTLPAANQCTLCHRQTEELKPEDHKLSWTKRHGKMAQMNRDSCVQCHSPTSCDQCHSRRDTLNASVHPGNFKMFHSIQARARPQSCMECHKSSSFCISCHQGK